ncbi:MAG TPA: hypothetical protein VFW62_06880, partial [bacterium]|nr:hypothetical protein [bacterium]
IRGPSQLNLPELAALDRERDPELRGEAWLDLARRIAQREDPESAASLYAELSRDESLPATVRQRARSRWAALRGEGDLSSSTEIFLSRFFQQVTDPAALFAMTVAGTAFHSVRWLALGRLAANPAANLLTRGAGARALAGLAGFAVEASAFPLAARLGGLALGRPSEWSAPLLEREVAASFLMLGALRAGGLVSGALAPHSGLWRPAIRQAGMLGGILLSREMETQAGWRERSGGAAALVDSLSTLLVFNVAGRLSRQLVGAGLRRWEIRTESQSTALSRNFPDWFGPLVPALTPTGRSPALGASEAFRGIEIALMQGNDGSSRPKGGAKVISLEEYRRRISPSQAQRPPEERSEPSPEVPSARSDRLALSYSREDWLNQLRTAMILWLAETPIPPDQEFRFLRGNLAGHSPELTSTLGLLAVRRPMAAQLLAVRLDLVRKSSWLRISPKMLEARNERLRDRYPDEVERHEIFHLGMERYLEIIEFSGHPRSTLQLNPAESRRIFERLPAELAEAWRDPLLTDEQFLHLSWWLGIFDRH